MTGELLFACNKCAASVFAVGISEPFHWDTLVLQVLPALLLVCCAFFFVLGVVRRHKAEIRRHCSEIMWGLSIGMFLLALFCVSLAIARTLVANAQVPIPATLTAHQVGCLLRLFAVTIPALGLTCLGALFLSHLTFTGEKR